MTIKRNGKFKPVLMQCAKAGCKNTFVPTKPWRKYCSSDCRTRAWVAKNYGPAKINRLKARVAKLERQLSQKSK